MRADRMALLVLVAPLVAVLWQYSHGPQQAFGHMYLADYSLNNLSLMALTIANVVRKLEEFGAMEYTIVVAATATVAEVLTHRAAGVGSQVLHGGGLGGGRGHDDGVFHRAELLHHCQRGAQAGRVRQSS